MHINYIDQVLDKNPPSPLLDTLTDQLLPADKIKLKFPNFPPCTNTVIHERFSAEIYLLEKIVHDNKLPITYNDIQKIFDMVLLVLYEKSANKLPLSIDYMTYKVFELLTSYEENKNILKKMPSFELPVKPDNDQSWEIICKKFDWPILKR
jgi:hypothetical protein